MNFYKCTPRQARKLMIQVMEADLVPYLQSSPGVGKSSITRSIAEDAELQLIDHRVATSDPTDFNGFPDRDRERGKGTFLPFDLFPVVGDEIPEGKNGWLLFLDEFSSAPRSVQAAAYKLTLDRVVGQHPLHQNVYIAAAGNLATDRAIVNNLSTAMQSRLVHLELEVNFEEWLEDVAIPQNYDPRIIAYLNQFPGKLMDFRPDHQEKTFCCPRTWEFVNRLIRNREIEDTTGILLAGTITSGVALEFVQFTKIYQDLVTVDQIVLDPQGCKIPEDLSLKWATITHMGEKADAQNLSKLMTYAARFDITFRILFFRMVANRNPQLQSHPAFGTAMSDLAKYLAA